MIILFIVILSTLSQNLKINIFNVDQADSELILFPSG
ncbi:hypothetical protein EIN_251500, partial [Entamoeba invadens IP1]